MPFIRKWFWVTRKALDWSASYVAGRCQRIMLGYCLSSNVHFYFRVNVKRVHVNSSSVLILGPLCPTLCTNALNCMISWSSESTTAMNGLQPCLASVQSWMLMNKLKRSLDRAKFLPIRNERQGSKYLSMFPIELYWCSYQPINIGSEFRNNSCYKYHVPLSYICGLQLIPLQYYNITILQY